MEQLLLEDFLRYRFLSGLKAAPGGEDLAFLCAMADREENSYPTDLWLLEKGETPRRLTGDGKTGAFLWDGPHTLLFVSRRDPQAQKLQEAGEEATAFYRLDTTGGEAVKAFQVPLTASPLEKVGDGRYLLSVQWDMAFSKAYRLKGKQKEELLQAKREERDYQVLDELPFYFNGKGYVNKKRAALFLYEEATGALTRVTPEAFDTASAHLSPDGKKLLYTGEKFVSKRREKSGVWVYDLLTGKTEELLPAREYELYDALWWGEKILLLATAQKRYGLNENAQFYTLDPQTREVALLCPYEDALGSSVGSDCRLGGGDAWTVHNGKLYFTATIRNASHLYALDQAGTISPVYTGEGSVDCLCLLGDTPYFVGMQQHQAPGDLRRGAGRPAPGHRSQPGGPLREVRGPAPEAHLCKRGHRPGRLGAAAQGLRPPEDLPRDFGHPRRAQNRVRGSVLPRDAGLGQPGVLCVLLQPQGRRRPGE